MTRWDMLMHYLAHLPYWERLLIGSGICFLIASLICVLIANAARHSKGAWQAAWMVPAIFFAICFFLSCLAIAVGPINQPLGFAGMLGYIITGLLLLRRRSIAESRPKNGPWG